MVAIAFPTDAVDGGTYEFQGTTYEYDALNNRWIAAAAGGGSIVVQQERPDPTTSSEGDLWWYCGADGEDPALFVLVADVNGVQHWMDASPGVAFEGSSSGGGGVTVADDVPTTLSKGDLWYRESTDSLYIFLDSLFRRIAVASTTDDIELLFSGVGTEPAITGFPGTPTSTFTSGTGTLDISSLDDDQWIIIYALGGGGDGQFSTYTSGTGGTAGNYGGGGGGGAAIVAFPKALLGNSIGYTVGAGGSGPAQSGGNTILTFDGARDDIIAGGGGFGSAAAVGSQGSAGGAGGQGFFFWPRSDDGLYEEVTGTGTSTGITDLAGAPVNGNSGQGISIGGFITPGSGSNSLFAGGGGTSAGAGTSTYAGNFGRGGSGRDGNGGGGFVRFYFPR